MKTIGLDASIKQLDKHFLTSLKQDSSGNIIAICPLTGAHVFKKLKQLNDWLKIESNYLTTEVLK